MTESCGGCAGVRAQTPRPIENRPGLNTLVYRIGTHSAFLATMQARLGRSLPALKTREASDPVPALLDAWAVVADVLTFYQERIANEGYLRTATERFSVVSLANLVGYAPRPGVAAGVFLAYTLQPGSRVTISAGSRAQSIPGPGELPQSFETSSDLDARDQWNSLTPRLTQPQALTPDLLGIGTSSGTGVPSGTGASSSQAAAPPIYLDGLVTRLKPNDPLLFLFGSGPGQQGWRRVEAVDVQAAQGRTKVTLLPLSPVPPAAASGVGASSGNGPGADVSLAVSAAAAPLSPVAVPPPAISLPPPASPPPALPPAPSLTAGLNQVLIGLQKPPSVPGPVPRDVGTVFASDSDASAQLLLAVDPRVKDTLYPALAAAAVTPASNLQNLYALRVKAAPFGSNAPRKPVLDGQGIVKGTEEWPLADPTVVGVILPTGFWSALEDRAQEGSGKEAEAEASVAPSEAASQSVEQVTLFLQTGSAGSSTQSPLPEQGTTQPYTLGSETVSGVVSNNGRSLTFDFTGQGQTISFAAPTNNSPLQTVTVSGGTAQGVVQGQTLQYTQGDTVIKITYGLSFLQVSVEAISSPPPVERAVLALDAQYDQILPGSWIVLTRPHDSSANAAQDTLFAQVLQTDTVSQTGYGFTATVTRLTLDRDWLYDTDRRLDVVRSTTVYAQAEAMTLTSGPVTVSVSTAPAPGGGQPLASGGQTAASGDPAPVGGDAIPLDTLYDGLSAGRWLIIAGERADADVAGIPAAELARIASVTHGFGTIDGDATPLPGDTLHSTLHLTAPLAYTYKRDTVTIYGNVVAATHGETRAETLGSGDGSQSFQTFALRQKPLTFVSAPTASGAADTLQVQVNSVLWHEADALSDLGPNDHGYVTQTGDDGQTSVIFGNGVQGARPPTGADNIRAVYRSGIGTPGNLASGRISLLATRPLGVKGVLNPLPATGGADREDRDQARSNAALAVKALDRLVSVQDYEDFARAYAGIGKAAARLFSEGLRPRVHLTVAGLADTLLTPDSDLLKNLAQSLRDFGDPGLAVQVLPATRRLLILAADIILLPDYEWDAVAAQIRASVAVRFGFAVRALGQGIPQSEAVAALQAVEGVSHVTLHVFDSFPLDPPDSLPARLASLTDDLSRQKQIAARTADVDRAAEIVFFSPDVPDTLLLTEATDAPDA